MMAAEITSSSTEPTQPHATQYWMIVFNDLNTITLLLNDITLTLLVNKIFLPHLPLSLWKQGLAERII